MDDEKKTNKQTAKTGEAVDRGPHARDWGPQEEFVNDISPSPAKPLSLNEARQRKAQSKARATLVKAWPSLVGAAVFYFVGKAILARLQERSLSRQP